MIRAVFFDLDGTLVNRDDACERWLQDFMGRHPAVFPLHSRATALRAFLDLDDHGYRERDEFCRQAMTAYPKLKMEPRQFREEFSSGIALFVQPRPIIGRMVQEFSKRYRVAVVTNGSARTQLAKLAASGLADLLPAFVSETVGNEKPHPRIFEYAAGSFGLQPREILFVGDDPDRDIAGASRVGMMTCWVSHGRKWPLARVTPTLQVERVEDLPSLFESEASREQPSAKRARAPEDDGP